MAETALDKFLNFIIPLLAIGFFMFALYSQPKIKEALGTFFAFVRDLFNKKGKGGNGGYDPYDSEVVYVPRERPERRY